MRQMRAAYQGSRTRVIVLWYEILLLGQWKEESRVSKAENFIFIFIPPARKPIWPTFSGTAINGIRELERNRITYPQVTR